MAEADGFNTTVKLDCGCTLRLNGDPGHPVTNAGDYWSCSTPGHSATVGYDPDDGSAKLDRDRRAVEVETDDVPTHAEPHFYLQWKGRARVSTFSASAASTAISTVGSPTVKCSACGRRWLLPDTFTLTPLAADWSGVVQDVHMDDDYWWERDDGG